MKILATLCLCLAATACDAQNKAPVNVAFDIYKGCIQGTLQAGNYPETQEEIPAFMESLDTLCVNWTIAWYPAFSTTKERRGLTDAELQRLDMRRGGLLADVNKELLIYVWNKK